MAMRTPSESTGPSVDGGDQQTLASSPTGSAVTALSGRSSVGPGLHHKSAWCTPPRIFMDHQLTDENQDEFFSHLEPGCLPSTADPDSMPNDKRKKVPHRRVRISAWKLAKVDSSEAKKAGAKARASSSVMRPIGERYDADQLSSTNISGFTSPTSTPHGGWHERSARALTSMLSPKYPPSRAGREDIETCGTSTSNLSSPPAPTPSGHTSSNRDHFNPIYQTSAGQTPSSVRAITGGGDTRRMMERVNTTRSSVFWDPAAGRFVSTASRSASSSAASGTELTYAGQSILFGGPIVSEPSSRGTRSGSLMPLAPQRNSTLSYQQQSRSQRGGQLPVFVPRESQHNQSSSR